MARKAENDLKWLEMARNDYSISLEMAGNS